MNKLLQTTLISAIFATSGFAATSTVPTNIPGTVTLDKTEVGEMEILENHIVYMGQSGPADQAEDFGIGTIAMGAGTKLTVSGKIMPEHLMADKAPEGMPVVQGKGQIKSTAEEGEEKPIVDITPTKFDDGTQISKDTEDLNESYKSIIGEDTGNWTLYKVTGGYIDPAIAYVPSKESFDIRSSSDPIGILALGQLDNARTMYDLDADGGSAKFNLNQNTALLNGHWSGQSFCSTGGGYPELTINVALNKFADLSQLTNGKVILKNDSSIDLGRSIKNWPKCDMDIEHETCNLDISSGEDGVVEVPAGKTWRVTGSHGLNISNELTVKGKLIL